MTLFIQRRTTKSGFYEFLSKLSPEAKSYFKTKVNPLTILIRSGTLSRTHYVAEFPGFVASLLGPTVFR